MDSHTTEHHHQQQQQQQHHHHHHGDDHTNGNGNVVIMKDVYGVDDDGMNDISLVGEEQSRLQKKGLCPWSEPPLGSLTTFASRNSKYPYCIVTLYQIIRDLHIKQEVVDIKVIDGKKWGRQEYFIGCKARSNDVERLLIPFHLDADIDLPWLQKVALECKEANRDLYLCIHTSETIM